MKNISVINKLIIAFVLAMVSFNSYSEIIFENSSFKIEISSDIQNETNFINKELAFAEKYNDALTALPEIGSEGYLEQSVELAMAYYIETGLLGTLNVTYQKGVLSDKSHRFIKMVYDTDSDDDLYDSLVSLNQDGRYEISEVLNINAVYADSVIGKKYKSGDLSENQFLSLLSVVALNNYYASQNVQLTGKLYAAEIEFQNQYDSDGNSKYFPYFKIGGALGKIADGISNQAAKFDRFLRENGVDLGAWANCITRGYADINLNKTFKVDVKPSLPFQKIPNLKRNFSSKDIDIKATPRLKMRTYNVPSDPTCTPIAASHVRVKVDVSISAEIGTLDSSAKWADTLYKEEVPIVKSQNIFSYPDFPISSIVNVKLAWDANFYMFVKSALKLGFERYKGKEIKTKGTDARFNFNIAFDCTITKCVLDTFSEDSKGSYGYSLDNDSDFNVSGADFSGTNGGSAEAFLISEIGANVHLYLDFTVVSVARIRTGIPVTAGVRLASWSYSGNRCGDTDFDGVQDYVKASMIGAELRYRADLKSNASLINPITFNIKSITDHIPLVDIEEIIIADQELYKKKLIKKTRTLYIDDLGSDNEIYHPQYGFKYDNDDEQYELKIGQRSCVPFNLDGKYDVIWSDGLTERKRVFTPSVDLTANVSASYSQHGLSKEITSNDIPIDVNANGVPQAPSLHWAWLIPIISNILN